MQYVGLNMAEIKRKNRASILTYINENGPASRKDLAEATGLTPAAISQMCKVLIEEDLLREVGRTSDSGAGRRKVLVDINYQFRCILAVNIEPVQTTIALSNLRGDAIECRRIPTDRMVSPETFIKRCAKICREISEKAENPISGLSVGITGIVDAQNGISVHAYGIWDKPVLIRDLFSRELKLTVLVENNVKAFAQAELFYGYGRKFDDLMIVKWGPGVGSTLIVNKQIYDGNDGKAGEIGHFIVEKNGALCTCGRRGCLETKVSHAALQSIEPFDEGRFGEVYERALKGGTSAPFDEAIDLLARTLINSMTLFAPDRIILSGSMFRSPAVRDKLVEYASSYDSAVDASRILYTDLSERESFIGPIAHFCLNALYYGFE